MSFFSADLYRDAAANWSYAAFVYLALLLGLSWIVTAAVLHHQFGQWAASEAPAVVEQIPPLSWNGGELSAEADQPYFLTDEAGEVLAVIDTTGAISTLEEAGARVLLTKNEAIVESNPNQVRIYRFQAINDFAVDAGRVQGWLNWLARWLGFLIFPVAVAASYVYRLVQVILYGLAGLLFARILRSPLPFPATARLATLALTPSVVLGTLIQLTKVRVPFPWLFSFLVAMIYLFFGVYANGSALRDEIE
ncbi:MAG TPA: DUF1189 family protein [Vicinamibacteria bacterium]|nr:DUF1189 family protein [Vicinamibacteria bacterium]